MMSDLGRRYAFITLSLVSIVAIAADLEAQSREQSGFLPYHPQIIGSGGAFIASDGFNSLFTNPALFAGEGSTVTYFSLTSWVHSGLGGLIPGLAALTTGNSASNGRVADEFESNGMGFGAAIGAGYRGNNLGLGISILNDNYVYGDRFPDRLQTEITTDIHFVFGYGYPFSIGPIEVAIGASLEPILRNHTFFNNSETERLLSDYLGTPFGGTDYAEGMNTLYGYGFRFHTGLLITWSDFQLGLVLSDIGNTRLLYSRTTYGEAIDNFQQLEIQEQANDDDEGFVPAGRFSIPMDMRLGAAWRPDFEWGIIDKSALFLEFGHLNLVRNDPPSFNIFHVLHLGGEVRLDDWFTVRAGLNQGRATLGSEFDLGLFGISLAWQQRIMKLPDDVGSGAGLLMNVAIRTQGR